MASEIWVLNTEQRLRPESANLGAAANFAGHPFQNAILQIYSSNSSALHELGEHGVAELAQMAVRARLKILRPDAGGVWREKPRPWRRLTFWQRLRLKITGKRPEALEPLYPNLVRAAGVEISDRVLSGCTVRVEFECDGMEYAPHQFDWADEVRAMVVFSTRNRMSARLTGT